MNDMYKHLMVDLETMGNQSFSSIVSIGAVEFDLETGETGREFYLPVDLQNCIDEGLIVNAGTVKWWLSQSEEARKKLTTEPGRSLRAALLDFSVFCNKEYQVWGNSARFDLGILQNAYDKLKMSIPWDFRKERCVRTLLSLAPEERDKVEFKGIAHDPIADCRYQIEYCYRVWANLNKVVV